MDVEEEKKPIISCRLCMSVIKDGTHSNIFTALDNKKPISRIVVICASVKVSQTDKLPKTICTDCLNKLLGFYEFRKLIKDSDAKFRTSIRTEEKMSKALKEQQEAKNDTGNESSDFDNGALNFDFPKVEFKEEPTDDNNSVKSLKVKRELRNNEQLKLEEQQSKIEKPQTRTEIRTKIYTDEDDDSSDGIPLSKLREKKEPKPKRWLIKKLKCKMCDKRFAFRHRLESHMSMHTGIKPFACNVCDKAFSLKSSLVQHQTIHSGVKPYTCEICGKSFQYASNLITHNRIHTEEKPYTCSTCGKSFRQVANLKAHELVHTDERPFACTLCEKRFKEKRLLKLHANSHTGIKTECCPTCGKMFADKKNLQKHMKIHTGIKPYTCDVCGSSFTEKGSLIVHMRIHTGVKPFTCEICGKSFNQGSILSRHMRVHSGEMPYPCTVCPKRFGYSHHLSKHMQQHHSNPIINQQNNHNIQQIVTNNDSIISVSSTSSTLQQQQHPNILINNDSNTITPPLITTHHHPNNMMNNLHSSDNNSPIPSPNLMPQHVYTNKNMLHPQMTQHNNFNVPNDSMNSLNLAKHNMHPLLINNANNPSLDTLDFTKRMQDHRGMNIINSQTGTAATPTSNTYTSLV